MWKKIKQTREIPEISTASLPDIIFMLLFFFMMVTVLRKDQVPVRIDLPQTEYQEKLEKERDKSVVLLTWNPSEKNSVAYLDGNAIPMAMIPQKLQAKSRAVDKDPSVYKVDLKADGKIPMHEIRNFKKILQQAGIKHLNYISTSFVDK